MNRALWLLLLVGVQAALLPAVLASSEPDYLDDNNDYDEEENEEEEGGTGDIPIISSKSRDLQPLEKTDVVLPCETEGGENVQLIWMKDKTILFTDKIRSGKDKRFERLDNGALKISKVMADDSGNYTCQMAIQSKPSITHQLRVLLAPRIINWVHGLKKTLNKGDSLTLSCSATGYPQPSISWSRKGRHMPNGEDTIDGESITFENVNRKHIGIYECMATNNVGDPATSSVEVEVKYAPEIEIEKAIVNSGEGSDAELVCEVHADPRPKVGWFKDGVAIPLKSDKYKISHAGSKHLLTIINTQKMDFGMYTCHANNTMGRVDKVVKLSGEPSPARYVSGEELENGQKLMWIVESHSPVSKFTLKYRNRKGGEWIEVHPPVENPEGNVYSVEHNLELTPGEYEAVLMSENTYGWSESSLPHLFNYKHAEDTSGAPSIKSQVLAVLTIASLSTFFL
ncbi:protein amalgam-like isoform X2 [Neocloeon triangulifer]|uniref:protein amalgam-like isoform X2 n=1 Tax=Neocloeon triangulifer TaxID=2078957 RepID=UPI00286F3D45|nr:protein amalgam-like isoform X2 [Neocloeon triangulifer]